MTPQRYSTRLTEMLGIEHPILAGGLQWLSDAAYVASAVNAGGMGFITWKSSPDLDHFRAELRRCNELTGGKRFGVNLSISSQPKNNVGLQEAIQIALKEGVRCFETVTQGNPGELFNVIHAGGGIVFHKSSAVKYAKKAEELGADIVGIVGHEEGGHPGDNELSTFTLGMAAAREIKAPVVVGGGVGTGEQIFAMLSLGIEGVVMGSRLLPASENWAHENYKKMLGTLDHNCSTVVFRTLHKLNGTWRILKNRTSAEVQRREREGKQEFADYADLIRGTIALEHVYKGGDIEAGMVALGPAAGFCGPIEPMETIYDKLLAEAAVAERRADGMRKVALAAA